MAARKTRKKSQTEHVTIQYTSLSEKSGKTAEMNAKRAAKLVNKGKVIIITE